MTSQGSPYTRFRRALDLQNATVAFAAATELDFVSLPDALELVLLVVDEPRRFRRAALRWHGRYCAEVSDVGFEEAHICAYTPVSAVIFPALTASVSVLWSRSFWSA